MTNTTTIEVAGTYEVRDGMVFATILGRKKATQLGDTPAEILAQMLMREIFAEASRGLARQSMEVERQAHVACESKLSQKAQTAGQLPLAEIAKALLPGNFAKGTTRT